MIPGCGAPPNITNIDWECERGYSGELHSLYFPCQGRCNLTGQVQYHLYCNTRFKWEVTDVSDGSRCHGKSQYCKSICFCKPFNFYRTCL